MKKLAGLLAGLCAIMTCLGCMFLSDKIYSAKAVTEEAETELVSEADVQAEAAASDVMVSGILQWTDDDGNVHPCRFVKVSVHAGTTGNYVSSEYTDSTGKYIIWVSSRYASDFRIRIYATTQLFQYEEICPIKLVYTSGISQIEYYDEIRYKNEASGVTLSKNYTMNSTFGQAMQIAHAAQYAAYYAYQMGRKNLGLVTIKYPYTNPQYPDTYQMFYQSGVIHVGNKAPYAGDPPSYASWDGIMHEYGHHVQNVFGISNGQGGSHMSNKNNIDTFCKLFDDDPIKSGITARGQSKTSGLKLAWNESWPTVFAMLAQQYFIDEIGNIRTVGDTVEESFCVPPESKRDIAKDVCGLGAACEYDVIAILYKLYDVSGYSFGHKKLWDTIMAAKATTFADFSNYLITNHLVNEELFKRLLRTHGMLPYNIELKDNDVNKVPTVVWEGTGGSVNYPYDQFKIYMYDKNFNSLRLNQVKVDPVLVNDDWDGTEKYVYQSGIGYVWWNVILQGEGSYFYCRIEAGYRNEDGLFISDYIKIKKPYLGDCSDYIGRFDCPQYQYAWCRFAAQQEGTYKIYAYNGKIFTADIFPYMVYNSYTTGRLESYANVNSFNYQKYFKAGEEIFIRIVFSRGDYGTFTINSVLANNNALQSLADFNKTEQPIGSLFIPDCERGGLWRSSFKQVT